MPGLFRTAGFPLVGQSHGGTAFSLPLSGVVTSAALLVFGGRPIFRPYGIRAYGELPLGGLMPHKRDPAHHFLGVWRQLVSARRMTQETAKLQGKNQWRLTDTRVHYAPVARGSRKLRAPEKKPGQKGRCK